MIDGIKILNLGVDVNKLKQNDFLDFIGHHSTKTGEVKNFIKKATYDSLIYTIIEDSTTTLNGSLHTYSNRGEHNYNDFNFNTIKNTIDDLASKFSIDINTTKLNNVEFGINIPLQYCPIIFIDSVVNHKGEPFYPMSKAIVKKGKGIECKHCNYYIKIYDKGKQNDLKENILRIEIKVIRMSYFKNKAHLSTLSDLKNKSLYHHLKNLFLKMLDNLLICDNYADTDLKLKLKDKLLLSNGTNPKYWTQLKPTEELKCKDKTKAEKQRKQYYKKQKNFISFIKKMGLLSLKNNVKKLSEGKWNELINCNIETCKEKTDKFPNNLETNSGQIPTIYKKRIITPKENPRVFCAITGADISDQKKGSKFISAKKIGYLEAHRIRNAFHDPIRNLKKRINKYDKTPTLFDMKSDDLICLSEKQKNVLHGKPMYC
jgi:hypothetical protein